MQQATLICGLILLSLSGCMGFYDLIRPPFNKDIQVCKYNGTVYTNADAQCAFTASCSLMCAHRPFAFYAANSCKISRSTRKLLKKGCQLTKRCRVKCTSKQKRNKGKRFQVTKKSVKSCKYKGKANSYFKKNCKLSKDCKIVCPQRKKRNRRRNRGFAWFELDE